VLGYWVDPPGYFDDLVWPQYVKWNAHLFPNGDAKVIDHEKIKDLVVMESDSSSIEQLATNAAKAIIKTLQT
jgi:nicotinamide/nicotinate riboside kinase